MLDNSPASKHIEQVRSLSRRCIRQSPVPVRDERAQFVAESEQFLDPLIQLFEAVTHESPNADARRAALVPNCQHSFQIRERKPDDERPLNEQHAVNRGGRVLPVPGRRPCDSRKKPLSLIVPKGIGADPSRSGRHLEDPSAP